MSTITTTTIRVYDDTINFAMTMWQRHAPFIGMASGTTSGFLAFLEQTKTVFGAMGVIATSIIALLALVDQLYKRVKRLCEWWKQRKSDASKQPPYLDL